MGDEQRPGGGLVGASRTALAQMAELTGAVAESVSELTVVDDGWRMNVEVLELERIPQSTSLLASYEVQADAGGNVTSYRRRRRYVRCEAGEV